MEERPAYPLARDLATSPRCESVIGIIICLNAITVGLDTMYREDEPKPWILNLSEHLSTIAFLAEFFLRIMAFSWAWVFDRYHLADCFLIWIPGVLVNWVLVPSGINADVLQRFAALRVLRLARLCRAVRMLPAFHELWVIVNGVMECSRLLLWAGVILATITFIFAVTIMETISRSERFEGDPLVQQHFGSVGSSMFTLFQLMTFDNWAAILRPIIFEAPETLLLFLIFMGIGGIVILNLMTAIAVKNAFDSTTNDEEIMAQMKSQQHNHLQRELYEMFQEMDEDKSGNLSREEFMDVLDDVMFVRKIKTLDIDIEELPDMFEILDDGDGEISIDEFCMGMTRMQGSALSRDVMSATRKMDGISKQFKNIAAYMASDAVDSFDEVEYGLDETSRNLIEMQVVTAEIFRCLNKIGLRRTLKQSLTALPNVPDPDIAKLANNERCQRRSANRKAHEPGHQPNRQRFVGHGLKPLPAEWVFERQKMKREVGRQQAMQLFAGTNAPATPQSELDAQSALLPGVPQLTHEETDSLDDLQIKLDINAATCALRAAGDAQKGATGVALPGFARKLQIDDVSSSV